MLTGEGPDAKMINNSDMKYGSYFGEAEVEEGKNVCVISDTDAKKLFGTDDVVGMSLDITCYDSSKSFRIMGVTTQKENGTFVSYTYDGMPVTVNIPYSSMDDLVGGTDEFYSITVVRQIRHWIRRLLQIRSYIFWKNVISVPVKIISMCRVFRMFCSQ